MDTTLVSVVRGDGEPVPGAADRDGVALRRAHRRKEATYPELIRAGARVRKFSVEFVSLSGVENNARKGLDVDQKPTSKA